MAQPLTQGSVMRGVVRRNALLVAVLAVVLLGSSMAVAAALLKEPARSPALCANGDPNLEPGIQG